MAVAEFNIGLMLAVSRKLALSAAGLQKGEHLGEPMEDIYDVPDVKNVIWGPLDENHPFTDYGIGFELYGKKLGIAGYGAIGREVAVRAKAFGMEILAYDPYMPAEKIEAERQGGRSRHDACRKRYGKYSSSGGGVDEGDRE